MLIWRNFLSESINSLFFSGASHKLALLEGHKFEFLSGGEDGLMIHIDIRQPKPNELAIQRSEKNERPVPIYRYIFKYYKFQPTLEFFEIRNKIPFLIAWKINHLYETPILREI